MREYQTKAGVFASIKDESLGANCSCRRQQCAAVTASNQKGAAGDSHTTCASSWKSADGKIMYRNTIP